MPKIGITIEKISEQPVELIIWYTRDIGFFYKNLSADFISVTHFPNGGYESEASLVSAFRKALNVYHEQMKQTKKIIQYSLEGSIEMIMNKVSEGHYSGRKHSVSSKFSTTTDGSGYVFGFNYAILLETSGTDKKRYYIIKEDGSVIREIQLSHNAHYIDYTPEREQFFKDMADNLQRLINGVSSFFDQPDMAKLMDVRGFKAIE